MYPLRAATPIACANEWSGTFGWLVSALGIRRFAIDVEGWFNDSLGYLIANRKQRIYVVQYKGRSVAKHSRLGWSLAGRR